MIRDADDPTARGPAALFRINKAFDGNGIKFAFAIVQLAGDGEPSGFGEM
jgi:hypothetical protein